MRPAGGEAPTVDQLEYAEDRRSVMVVNGRDGINAAALFTFLRAIGLRPLEWSKLVGAANSGAPYIGQVLDEAFAGAQAVVILQTPDDIAYLRPELVPEGDPENELAPRGQARPNVFFEAGMAIGRFPQRTVFVEIGAMRAASDLAGRHAVRIDSGAEWRLDLAKRLERAGCEVDLEGTAWLSAGDFVLPGEISAAASVAPSGPQAALIGRIDAFIADLQGNGQASMTLATTFNELVEESGVDGIPRARPISRAMSELGALEHQGRRHARPPGPVEGETRRGGGR